MLTLLRQGTTPWGGKAAGWDHFRPASRFMCRLATGRSALAHLAGRVKPSAVLMPCYVPEGVIRPFVAAGIPIMFYQLGADLSPDPSSVAQVIATAGQRPLVVVIHYFGFPASVEPLRQSVAGHNGLLVEDCAHALVSRAADGTALGSRADFVLYSLNKFLPAPDGAVLLALRNDMDVTLDEASLPPLPFPALSAYADHLRLNADVAACEDGAAAMALLSSSGRAYEAYYREINTDLTVRRQSETAHAVEQGTDFADLAARRHANAVMLSAGLKNPLTQPLFPAIPTGTAPFCLPVRVPPNRRAEISQALMEEGVIASTLVDKWDFIPEDEGSPFAVERAFLAEHLLLPVSEFIEPAEIMAMLSALNHLV